jgi:thymidylate synthase
MKGDTNIKYLVDNGVSIWTRDAFNYNLDKMVNDGIFSDNMQKYSLDWVKSLKEYEQRIKEDLEFSYKYGNLGPVYGAQWRKFKSVDENGNVIETDQFKKFIDTLIKKPTSKKNIVSAWNPGELDRMALEPCHLLFQSCSDGEFLDLQMYQRSCDQFLGVPFNIASYSMLTTIIAQQTELKPRAFIHTFGDSHFYCGLGKRAEWYVEKSNRDKLIDMISKVDHIDDYKKILNYLNENLPPAELIGEIMGEKSYDSDYDHVTAVLEQLSRQPKKLPKLEITKKDFDELTVDDFKILDYEPHPLIRRKMAV